MEFGPFKIDAGIEPPPGPRGKVIRFIYWILVLLVLLGAVSTEFYRNFQNFSSKHDPEKTASCCNCKLFYDNPTPGREKYETDTTVSDYSSAAGNNCALLREKAIRRVFAKLDDRLRKEGKDAYGADIADYFDPGDINNEKIGQVLIKRRFVFLKERIDTPRQKYILTASLFITPRSKVDSLIAFVQDTACLRHVMDSISNAWARNGGGQVTMEAMVDTVCAHCRSAREAFAFCGGHGGNDCAKILFGFDKYEPGPYYAQILKQFCSALRMLDLHGVSLELVGYTDPVPFAPSGIVLPKGIRVGGPGELLDDITGNLTDTIKDNQMLSCARAYCVYTLMREKLAGLPVILKYTGMGVNDAVGGDAEKRSVKIIYTVNKKYRVN